MTGELTASAALIFFFAAFIHGSVGFGFPMIATPLLSIFMDVQAAVALTLLPTLMINTVSIASEGQLSSAVRRYLPLALMAMLGSAIGTQILLQFDSALFKILLAAAIVFYLIADQAEFHLPWVKRRPRLSLYLFGLLAGILGGLTNVMAPVLVIYALETGYTKAETVQALNLCFFLGKCVQLLLFIANNRYGAAVFEMSLIGLLLSGLAIFLGLRLRRMIPQAVYRVLLKLLLAALAGVLFFRAA